MKYASQLGLVLLLMTAHATAGEKKDPGTLSPAEAGWQPLFDGKSLDAWDMTDKTGIWAINLQGELYVARPGGALFTKQRYCDYVLEVDWKIASKQQSNSGVFLRTHDKKDEVHTGLEIQILDDADYHYAWNTVDATGSIYDMVAPTLNAVKPPGQWNHYRITANANWVTVELNGQEIVKADLDRWTAAHKNPDGTPNKFRNAMGLLPREGFIGLQNHGGLPVWFRDIRIKALTDRKPRYTGNEPVKDVLIAPK